MANSNARGLIPHKGILLSVCAAVLLYSGMTRAAPVAVLLEPAEPVRLTYTQLVEAAGEVLHDALRVRAVEIAPAVLAPGHLSAGDRLALELFDERGLSATIQRVHTDINGVTGLIARIDDTQFGFVSLSIKDGRVLGAVEIPERREGYQLAHIPAIGGHVLYLRDPARTTVPAPGPSTTPPRSALVEPVRPAPAAPRGGPVDIDLMIVYTAAAASWADSNTGGIELSISEAMNWATTTLQGSELNLNLNLIHTAMVGYTESGDSNLDLQRLSSHPGNDPWGEAGHMDEVHVWRDTAGADLVVLLADNTDYGGMGWILNWMGGQPDWGFSIAAAQWVHYSLLLIHEVGHNLGAHHHKGQITEPGPAEFLIWNGSDWVPDPDIQYAAGWRWFVDGGYKCSAMTYCAGSEWKDGQGGVPVALFSIPERTWDGVPMGHAADGDNARIIRQTKHLVAHYRENQVLIHSDRFEATE